MHQISLLKIKKKHNTFIIKNTLLQGNRKLCIEHHYKKLLTRVKNRKNTIGRSKLDAHNSATRAMIIPLKIHVTRIPKGIEDGFQTHVRYDHIGPSTWVEQHVASGARKLEILVN